jgi:hypothetical protein
MGQFCGELVRQKKTISHALSYVWKLK